MTAAAEGRAPELPADVVAFLRREASLAGHAEARIAAYVARVELELGDAVVSRALGMSRSQIRAALGAIEEAREDAEFDEWVDRVANGAREIMH